MTNQLDIDQRYGRAKQQLAEHQQSHLLRWWPELNEPSQQNLLDQIEAIDWPAVDKLIETHVRAKPLSVEVGELQPVLVYPASPDESQEPLYADAMERGEAMLRAGRVAAFTVAGGLGSRLGFDGPKGMVPVTPIRKKTLFELFAEMITAAGQRYDVSIPWYVMTSPVNHEQTLAYFSDHDFFGLPESDVMLFPQGVWPMFAQDGQVLLCAKDSIALGPDGHGGSLKALRVSGCLADMKQRGVAVISYFQVDNPLVKPFDRLFLGLHESTGSDMSTKAVPKASDEERVGHICLNNGKVSVVEYSDFPEPLTREREADGSRRFNAGNAAIHLLNVSFVERIVGDVFQLPYRRADKAVSYIDDSGLLQESNEPNAVKLETFIFDALSLASNPLVLEVDRAEEFSPVKNASGADTLKTARMDQIRRAYHWLTQAGVKVPTDEYGEPTVAIEISPLFAQSAADVADRRQLIKPIDPTVDQVLA